MSPWSGVSFHSRTVCAALRCRDRTSARDCSKRLRQRPRNAIRTSEADRRNEAPWPISSVGRPRLRVASQELDVFARQPASAQPGRSASRGAIGANVCRIGSLFPRCWFSPETVSASRVRCSYWPQYSVRMIFRLKRRIVRLGCTGRIESRH